MLKLQILYESPGKERRDGQGYTMQRAGKSRIHKAGHFRMEQVDQSRPRQRERTKIILQGLPRRSGIPKEAKQSARRVRDEPEEDEREKVRQGRGEDPKELGEKPREMAAG